MKFKVRSELEYNVKMPSTFIFNIQAARTAGQCILEEAVTIDPYFKMDEFTSKDGTARFLRLQVKDRCTFKIVYEAKVDVHYRVISEEKHSDNVQVAKLDVDIIPYIFPSRYCQSDKLQRLAVKEFGDIDDTYEKVLAISDWIYNNVEYLTGSTNSSTSALDTISERAGVCRDFAHLGITLCRALSIPARYFTGYAYKLEPQDFHACFEAYIDGEWMIFDPTHLVALNSLVKISNGRDAADASVASIFGNTSCTKMIVQCDAIDEPFEPYPFDEKKNIEAVSYA